MARLTRPGYKSTVTARLEELDLYVMLRQTETNLAFVRDNITSKVGVDGVAAHSDELVRAALLPKDVKKNRHYLFFHIDQSPADEKRKPFILSAHLSFRARPSGGLPKQLADWRKSGITIEWLEGEMRGLFDDPVTFVEAHLRLKQGDAGTRTVMDPPLRLGGADLRRRGEEYRADKAEVGKVNKYRWSEDDDGTADVWLSYAHTDKPSGGFWAEEQRRCLGFLERL